MILEVVRKLYMKTDAKNDHTIREAKRKLRLGCLEGKNLFLKVEELAQHCSKFSEMLLGYETFDSYGGVKVLNLSNKTLALMITEHIPTS